MTERLYRDDEVRTIFKLATTQKAADVPSSSIDGLTLAEIQSIGREAGLEPDAVALAAIALDAPPVKPPRTSLAMPIEVRHTVALPRAMSDQEWEHLIVELRSTFRARGKITTHGSLREWSNGNLHAAVEPTETGSRLTIGTIKGDASGVNALGVMSAVGAGITLGFALVAETVTPFLTPLILATTSSGVFLTNWVRLTRWRQERAQQMDHIASRIRTIMGA
jgi:hypothetical protein